MKRLSDDPAVRLAECRGLSPAEASRLYADGSVNFGLEDVRAVVDGLEGKLAIRNITIEQLTRKVEELEELVTDLRGKARG